jgi:hypothetical protein
VWRLLTKEIRGRVRSFIRDRRDDGWRASNLLWGIIPAVLLISILVLTWQKFQRPAVVEYDGHIVDRWAGFSESDTGSRAYYKLLVEEDGGKRITVVVDGGTYTRAQVGMRIRVSNNRIELSGEPAHTMP